EIHLPVRLRVIVARAIRPFTVIAHPAGAGPVGRIVRRRRIVEFEALVDVPGVTAEVHRLDEGLRAGRSRRADADLPAQLPTRAAERRMQVRALGGDDRMPHLVVEHGATRAWASRISGWVAVVAAAD